MHCYCCRHVATDERQEQLSVDFGADESDLQRHPPPVAYVTFPGAVPAVVCGFGIRNNGFRLF